MKLKTLHEDIIGDLKRKLKGQVSLADNIRRVAQFELKSALARVETLEELAVPELDREIGPSKMLKITKLFTQTQKTLKQAQKDLDKIK